MAHDNWCLASEQCGHITKQERPYILSFSQSAPKLSPTVKSHGSTPNRYTLNSSLKSEPYRPDDLLACSPRSGGSCCWRSCRRRRRGCLTQIRHLLNNTLCQPFPSHQEVHARFSLLPDLSLGTRNLAEETPADKKNKPKQSWSMRCVGYLSTRIIGTRKRRWCVCRVLIFYFGHHGCSISSTCYMFFQTFIDIAIPVL